MILKNLFRRRAAEAPRKSIEELFAESNENHRRQLERQATLYAGGSAFEWASLGLAAIGLAGCFWYLLKGRGQ